MDHPQPQRPDPLLCRRHAQAGGGRGGHSPGSGVKAAAAALALVAPAAALAAPCDAPACNFAMLAPVLAKLHAARIASGTPPVHILQIGDSHTARDAITGAWRDLLQIGAGDGG